MAVRHRNGVRRYRLTPKEVQALIDREARKRLGISGEEFVKRLKQGGLSESVAKRDLEMLVRLLDEKKVQ